MDWEAYREEVDAVSGDPGSEERMIERLRRAVPAARTRRRRIGAVLTAAALSVLLLTGIAAGGALIATGYGGHLTVGIRRDGDGNAVRWSRVADPGDPGFVELREGRVWLTAWDAEEDITDEISTDRACVRRHQDGEGVVHYLIVGGDPQTPGWGEFLQGADGAWIGGYVHDPASGSGGGYLYGDGEDAPPPPYGDRLEKWCPWLTDAKAQIGLPW